MKKKIIIISILAVFMLIAISLISASNAQTTKTNEKKVSPLFGIRARRAIGDRLKELKENIITNSIRGRIFFAFKPIKINDNIDVLWSNWTCISCLNTMCPNEFKCIPTSAPAC